MVERHIIRPRAGRMRPKTSESGIFSTNRNRPVSTSMLTRMLVPNPKNAFQSPETHRVGLFMYAVVAVATILSPLMICPISRTGSPGCGFVRSHANDMPAGGRENVLALEGKGAIFGMEEF